MENKREELRKK